MIGVTYIAKQCIQHALHMPGGLIRLFASLTIILYIFCFTMIAEIVCFGFRRFKITMCFKKTGGDNQIPKKNNKQKV